MDTNLEYLYNEVNECPVQEASNHILNTLNDDCIQEILRRLTNIRDFLNAAEVCTRFQKNAIVCLPSHFKMIYIRDGHFFSNSVPVEQLERFLSIFGNSIKSIRWNSTDRELDNAIFNTISNSCSKNLLDLTITDHGIDFTSQFNALEKLEIETSLINSFKFQPQLKILKLKLVKVLHFDSFKQSIQTLQEVEFVNVNGFTDETLVEFLKCNPQLKRLKLEGCKRISTSVLRNISEHVSKIVSLNVMFFSSFFEKSDMLHISELRKLQLLGINCPKFSAKTLIELMIENEVPLEDLTISGYVDDLAESILKLKLLKKLNVGNVCEEVFITFAKKLHFLEEIRIECNDISIRGLNEALKCGKNLTMLTIVIGCRIVIDLSTYNSILTLAKDRVRVLLMIRTLKHESKRTNFSLNREWVNVCYF